MVLQTVVLELSVYWVSLFSLGYVCFLLSTSISVWLRRPLVSDFSILGFFFFLRIRGFATICNLLGLLYLVFFFRLGLLYRLMLGFFFPGGLALLQFYKESLLLFF